MGAPRSIGADRIWAHRLQIQHFFWRGLGGGSCGFLGIIDNRAIDRAQKRYPDLVGYRRRAVGFAPAVGR